MSYVAYGAGVFRWEEDVCGIWVRAVVWVRTWFGFAARRLGLIGFVFSRGAEGDIGVSLCGK